MEKGDKCVLLDLVKSFDTIDHKGNEDGDEGD